jgi:hypothetical protein
LFPLTINTVDPLQLSILCTLLSIIIHYFPLSLTMHISPLILGLIATLTTLSPVSAHGKVAVVQGDAGGNGTALGIIGGIVPGYGPNDETEIDTTVFKRVRIATDGLGKTTGDGDNKAGCLINTMMQSGSVLPQVSAENGSISGTFHIVTTVSNWNSNFKAKTQADFYRTVLVPYRQ